MSRPMLTLSAIVLAGTLAGCGATTDLVSEAAGATPGVSAGAASEPPDPIQSIAASEAPPDDLSGLDLPLMDTADLTDGLPVPVPAGGVVDDEFAVFEGQSFVVAYPTNMYDALSAFYDAWFVSEGIDVPPEFPSEGSRTWRPEIDGVPVEVQLYPISNEDALRVVVLWP